MHGCEAGTGRSGNKAGPALDHGSNISDRDRLTGGVAVDARPFVGLQLEELELSGLLGGGGQQAQLLKRIGEQKPRGRDVEQLRATLGEPSQQVDHVEVVEQAVNERDHGIQYPDLTSGVSHAASFRDVSIPPDAHQSASSFKRRSRMSRAM